jgi:hypothetical protein
MMTTLYLLTTMLAVSTLSAQLQSVETLGPFGFHRGMTRNEVIQLVGEGAINAVNSKDDALSLTTAPKPHPSLARYSLLISPSSGLLKIIATTDTIQTDRFGDEVKLVYNELLRALEAKYGHPTKEYKNKIFAYWKLAAGNPNNIDTVMVEANSLSRTSGYVAVTYFFDGLTSYVESKKAVF